MDTTRSYHTTTPKESNISQQEFASLCYALVEACWSIDKTLLQRSLEEYIRYYDHTLFLCLDNKIIWKSSIIPTNKISYNNLKIWETTGTLIHPDFRWKWYGSLLVDQTHEIYGKQYDIILWWTINNIMSSMRQKRWYESISFPLKLYTEWKQYFSPLLDWGEDEFNKRAVCLAQFSSEIDEKTKSDFIHLFYNW